MHSPGQLACCCDILRRSGMYCWFCTICWATPSVHFRSRSRFQHVSKYHKLKSPFCCLSDTSVMAFSCTGWWCCSCTWNQGTLCHCGPGHPLYNTGMHSLAWTLITYFWLVTTTQTLQHILAQTVCSSVFLGHILRHLTRRDAIFWWRNNKSWIRPLPSTTACYITDLHCWQTGRTWAAVNADCFQH